MTNRKNIQGQTHRSAPTVDGHGERITVTFFYVSSVIRHQLLHFQSHTCVDFSARVWVIQIRKRISKLGWGFIVKQIIHLQTESQKIDFLAEIKIEIGTGSYSFGQVLYLRVR